MKKNMIQIGAAVMAGVTMIASIPLLSASAKSDFSSMQDEVFTKEAPLEITEPLQTESAIDTQIAAKERELLQGKTLSVVRELTEIQFAPFIEMAKDEMKNKLDIVIPEESVLDVTAAYEDTVTGDINIDIVWTNNDSSQKSDRQSAINSPTFYSVSLKKADIENGTATLEYLWTSGNNYESKLKALIEKGISSFEAQLGMTVPENCTLEFTLSYTPEAGSVGAVINWFDYTVKQTALDPLSSPDADFYQVSYEHVDFKKGTGEMRSLNKDRLYRFDIPDFTSSQKATLIAAARNFAAKMDLKIGDIKRDLALGIEETSVLRITFDGLNGKELEITVREDGKILGYDTN